jgi:hypothetical protein
VKERLELR